MSDEINPNHIPPSELEKYEADAVGEAEIRAEAERLAQIEAQRQAAWEEIIKVPHRMTHEGPVVLTPDEIKEEEERAIQYEEFKRARDMDAVRAQRNRLLLESDWTQLPDNGLNDEKRMAWRTYRQNLRNLMEGLDDPAAVVWPDQPD